MMFELSVIAEVNHNVTDGNKEMDTDMPWVFGIQASQIALE